MNQLWFRPVQHLKMTVWSSVLWKILMWLAKKVQKWSHESIFQLQIKLISYRSEFWHIRRKSAVLYSKWLFCQKNGVFMNHIIKLNFRWKNKMFSELFTTQKIEKKFVTFLTGQSLILYQELETSWSNWH